MKNLIFLTLLYLIPIFSIAQLNNLDFERRESIELDYQPFFESISEDNRLNNNTISNNNLYSTLNYNKIISSVNRVQGVINHNFKGNFIQFEAISSLQPINEVSIVNCTQNGDNLLVSGSNYHNLITISSTGGSTLTIPNMSNGVLMSSTNPTNFQHDFVEFNFMSIPPAPSPSVITSNHFVFITDAVMDNSGNIYAVGTINNNINHLGHSFLIKLDPNYNIVDMRLNLTISSTFERIVYDDVTNEIFMVGRGIKFDSSATLTPIIAKYDINSSLFSIKAYDIPEVFFDIKKDLISNQLVVGWCDFHLHDLGLLFFDNNLNLLSERTWENPVGTFDFGDVSDSLVVFSNKPNSIYIGASEIFIRGSGSRRYNDPLNLDRWLGNFHYNTDRFSYLNINASYSGGRYIENSTNLLFQTMNGIHPWFPKRLMNLNDDMISITDMPHILFPNPAPINNHGIDYLKNYNINPSLSLNTAVSIVGCASTIDFSVLNRTFLTFKEVQDDKYNFLSYTPLSSDYTNILNQNLIPFIPNQNYCDGSSNPAYKNIAINNEQIIKSYKIYNAVGQLVVKNIGDNSSNVDNFIRKIKAENLFNKGIHLIEIETNLGLVHIKEMF